MKADHSMEHELYCESRTSGAWRKSIPADKCPYCICWNEAFNAGVLFQQGKDNDKFSITIEGGTA